jgi:ribose transport system substrate-binding protein
MRLARHAWLLCAIGLLAALIAGCGGSGSSSSSGSNSTEAGTTENAAAETGGESGAEFVSEAEKALEANYAGTDRKLPSSAPKPPAHENVWIIACSLSAEGCKAPAEGAAEAVEALGWEAHVADGKLDPSVYNSLVHQAVSAGADAIILVSVDCSLTKASLEAAKKAGVKIVGLYALDCDDKFGGGGEPLFDTQVYYENGMTYGEWLEGPYSESAADYVIAKTHGKANVISMRENDVASVKHVSEGFERAMEKCTTCKVTTVEFTGADLLDGNLQSKTQTALSQDPEADVVFASYDAAVQLGIAAGVEASGRGSEILLIGGEGLAPNIAMIKSGKGQSFAAGAPARWVGWAAVDELIRSLDGEEPVDEGIGLQSIDKEHNIPNETPYYDGNVNAEGKPKQNYEANFKKIWGLG